MRIVIAGGSGFLGSALTDALTHENHDVTVLTRHARSADAGNPRVSYRAWTPNWARPDLGQKR
jgi:nucleoside-diphosphate-sugar epimerase